MKTAERPVGRPETLPVSAEVDVLVAGGGPAGVSAGFAAARLGAKTIVIEQMNCLGGIATAGGHNHICLYSAWASATRLVGGVIWEMAGRAHEAGYGRLDSSSTDFELEGMKLVLERMAGECGVSLLYYTQVADAVVEDGVVKGVVVQNKTGRSVVLAKRVVDCTGDGDVAARAGCGFDKGAQGAGGDGGGEGAGLMQPVTLMFQIGGVDWERVKAFRAEVGDGKLEAVWKKAQDAGDMRSFQSQIMGWWWTPTRPDQVGCNFTHVNRVDGTKAEELTRATVEAREQAFESVEVYRKYVPGMEGCYMVSTPNTVGVRDTRRIHGLYTLTKDDLMAQREFDDSIGYGSFFIDIHNLTGPGMDVKTVRPEKGFRYQIPYRIIVPKDVGGLLVAGRCASATHEALGSLRVMPQCGVMGQAAATAAVISIEDGVAPRDVNVKVLQDSLRAQGCIVDAADVEKANA